MNCALSAYRAPVPVPMMERRQANRHASKVIALGAEAVEFHTNK